MDVLTQIFTALVATASGLAFIAVWSRRRLALKLAALALAAGTMGLGYGALAELLGRPKPTTLEWARAAAEEAVVLGATVREDEAIYLWLQLSPDQAPMAYALPYSRPAAEQLQQAMRQAEADGTGVRARRPFRPGVKTDEPQFYAEPQRPPPPKRRQGG